jgi:hypothetical protein
MNPKETGGNTRSDVKSYKVSGFYLECTFPFNCLTPTNHAPDVRVRWGKVPEQLEEPTYIGASFQAKPGEYLQKVNNVARYLVRNGNEITIEPFPGVKEQEVVYFLLNTLLGILAQQRGCLVIQASALEVNGKAVLFAGPSASGKSTMALLLQQNNYKVISDEVCTISFNEKELPILHRGNSCLNLWADTLNKMHLSTSAYQLVREGIRKYHFPIPQTNLDPIPVECLYALWGTKNSANVIQPLSGLKKITAINNSMWRKELMHQIGDRFQYFSKREQLAKTIRVSQLERQYDPFCSEELVEMLQKDFSI